MTTQEAFDHLDGLAVDAKGKEAVRVIGAHMETLARALTTATQHANASVDVFHSSQEIVKRVQGACDSGEPAVFLPADWKRWLDATDRFHVEHRLLKAVFAEIGKVQANG